MQELTVIGIDDGALVVSTDGGERYRLVIDDSVQLKLRQLASAGDNAARVSPREIQAQIRSGLSADEVAAATGVAIEFVERFEGPVLAERQHTIDSALRVPVKIVSQTDPLSEEHNTFGEVIDERLVGLGASDIRWASWKEESGWVVKLTFTSGSVDHDARWQYDAKRHSLNPLNAGAVTLSQAGEIVGGLIPRLRAVGGDAPKEPTDFVATLIPDQLASSPAAENNPATPTNEPIPHPATGPQAVHPASGRAPVSSPAWPQAPSDDSSNQTADLLEVLRRRRGERESTPFADEDHDDDETFAPAPSVSRPVASLTPVRSEEAPASGEASSAASGDDADDDSDIAELLSAISDDSDAEASETEPEDTTLPGLEKTPAEEREAPRPRRTRTTMPSWDEIVFGARSDDDVS